MSSATAVLRGVVRGYQLVFRPMLGQNCRFFPSCSDYALEALGRHGAMKGMWLAGRRICRCHPWNPGGFDPVPGGQAAVTEVGHHEDEEHGPDRKRNAALRASGRNDKP